MAFPQAKTAEKAKRKAAGPKPIFVVYKGEATDILAVSRKAEDVLDTIDANPGCRTKKVMLPVTRRTPQA